MVMVVPCPPEVGVKDVMVGGGIKVKPARVPVPPGPVMSTLPELPVATTAVICVSESTVNDAAAVPPKLTAVAPVKLRPLMVTL